MAHRVSVRNQKDEITGSSRALQNGFRAENLAQRKNWERQFFYILTPALMGDPCSEGKRVTSAKLPCELKEIAKFLAPFKKRLEQVAVESTYNWYWLVDGLQALKYPVVLANPAAMQQ